MSSRSSARKPSGLPLVKQPVIDIADDDTSDDDDDDEDLGHYRQRRGYAADRSRESTCDSDITVPYTKIISTFAIDCTGSLAAFGGYTFFRFFFFFFFLVFFLFLLFSLFLT
jgi:hypothetical protein